MNKNRGVTIFIPVYNEESVIVENTNQLINFIDDYSIDYEIMIVSNGSTDKTIELGEILSSSNNRIKFVHIDKKGVGLAFKKGIELAEFDKIITVDIDLSINIEFIINAYLLLDDFDIVIGSKITGNQKRSWMRKFASNLFINCAKMLLKISFHDYSIGAKGYNKELALKYIDNIDDETFYVVKLIYFAYQEGKKIKEIPVECIDLRESRFNLLYEGFYKFSNLFFLWGIKNFLGKKY
ncbi:MAG: glycosyltransferase family 2 protein [Desulfobacterales bacterium]|nr:glycosyltransferase family 2 protein [Desulfobacterales bacterium]